LKITIAEKTILRAAYFGELNEYGHRNRCAEHPSYSEAFSFIHTTSVSRKVKEITKPTANEMHSFLLCSFPRRIR
jgi:hypothetical protein